MNGVLCKAKDYTCRPVSPINEADHYQRVLFQASQYVVYHKVKNAVGDPVL